MIGNTARMSTCQLGACLAAAEGSVLPGGRMRPRGDMM
jgi:hypothetical protein